MARHEAWLHCVNLAIILVGSALVTGGLLSLSHPWWQLMPNGFCDRFVKVYAMCLSAQVLCCLCGSLGACTSRLVLLKVYWVLMISLVVADIAIALPFIDDISTAYNGFEENLDQLAQAGNSSVCVNLMSVVSETSCCLSSAFENSCQIENESTQSSCVVILLQWLHHRAEFVAIIIYFFLLPLKCIVVFVLREDIRQIFTRRELSRKSRDWEEEDEEEYFFERKVFKEVVSEPPRLYGG